MVSAVHGTLLECDIPTKVFILHLNDEQLPSERFVIQDLDATHLLVQPHKMGREGWLTTFHHVIFCKSKHQSMTP
jgi:hypothetical protein